MTATPRPTDVEIGRSLNAVVTSLNDWRVASVRDVDLQALVTGALGGEQRILVRLGGVAEGAELTDGQGHVLARVVRREERWIGERVGAPVGGGYVPSDRVR